jgi:PmbA protein
MSELAQLIMKTLTGKYDEVSVLVVKKESAMTKLWNTEPSITQSWSETHIHLRLTKSRRLWVLSFETRDPLSIIKDSESLLSLVDRVEEAQLYSPLPEPGKCSPIEEAYDSKIESFMDNPVEPLEQMINAAIAQGVDRVAGTLTLSKITITLVSSNGFECSEVKSQVEAYARAFKGEISGHWAHGSTRLDLKAIEDVGRRAGYYATLTKTKVDILPGEYNVALSPLVVGNLFNYLAYMASALQMLMGFSVFLKYPPGVRIGSELLTLIDKPRDPTLPGVRGFDDEGVETFNKPIIEKGVVRSILHNSATAAKLGAKTTGNAGWIFPTPWNLEIAEGDVREEEIAQLVKDGLIITNNWYTRLQNYYEGYFSTVSRDVALLVRNGEIVGHVGRVRIATSYPRLLSSLVGVTKNRYDVSWWEVRIPTRAPFMIFEKVNITKPEV